MTKSRGTQARMDDVILATEGLTKEFQGFVAVNDVGLKVRRGTIHALIGPNGAGKTTCFNLLTKFLNPTRGRIVYNGRDITAARPADIARLGLVRSFQISAVFPHLTVLENVRIALQRARGGSFDFWRSKRVLDPEMMLLDEPTAGMGHEDIDRIAALIKTVAANRTVLMVEHNLSVVANLSHCITVLTRGRILAEGDYDKVSGDPAVREAYMGVGHG